MAEPEIVEVVDRAAWRRWLTRHHRRPDAVWLVIHKRTSTSGSLRYEEAVEEALCFGWIDSKANKLDDARYKLWMAPRKPKSVWSAVNKRRVEELVASEAMDQAGMAAVEAAKADGSWSALDRSDALELPADLLGRVRPARGVSRELGRLPAGGAQADPRMGLLGQARRDACEASRRDRETRCAERTREPVAPQELNAGGSIGLSRRRSRNVR